MKIPYIVLILILILYTGVSFVYADSEVESSGEKDAGACRQYAELVCELCGEDADVCSEIREKSKEKPNHPVCKKGMRLLPAALEEANDKDREKIMRALCKKEMPAVTPQSPDTQ